MLKSNNASETTTRKVGDKTAKKVFFRRRKGCPLSVPNAPVIDYKNPELLIKFVSEGGRMLPSRITNVCAKKQRKLNNAIKIARILALLPFVFQAK
ncbi:30S ribosomal protein S18 [Rickettsia asembonensis]|uniref:Small ribosomal subunit protein bS18 n=1 Tax=Rickettsia asembonensis TaxID=1068590 RepID=A0A0C2RD71_9RICK|nr:30S ribosomal protein S18 [Rickettsia asembonensis]MCC8407141.1 30S ribosomal protein S18 [Rickettsia endosymbiont of Sceptobius lativentris]MCC8461993.1 30S ribosomal protein S18 [Rickettsia endosymbiont of Ecitomorpha arachnoides]HJD58437.1 30S ribosomal protein S18 [Rickettsia endosymbiont of Ceroptres masudai]KIJ88760.1 30S ribosomal protein S18 [Rickettsia asembonensis]WCR56570.1 MAG: 30S ribosomal protein S18 [Rickettsia asembonensis]